MIVQQTFTIPGSDQRPILLDLTYNTENESGPMVIFVHGFKGFKDWGSHNLVAEFFAGKGYRFLKFNFSHNGTTPENPLEFADLGAFSDNTFTKEFYDLDQVISFALSGQSFSPPRSICLLGHSRGGGTCIIQSVNDNRISKLITWASISRFNSLWKAEEEDEWRKKGIIYTYNVRTKQNTPLKVDLLHDLEKHARRYDVTKSSGDVNIPWLIIHGDNDVNVSIKEGEELHRRAPRSEFYLVSGADHVFGSSHPFQGEELPVALQLICEKSVEFLEKSSVD